MASFLKLACIALAATPAVSWPAAGPAVAKDDSQWVPADSARRSVDPAALLRPRSAPTEPFYLDSGGNRKVPLKGFDKPIMTAGRQVGHGKYGQVFDIQGHPDLVIKITDPFTTDAIQMAKTRKMALNDAEMLKDFSATGSGFVPEYIGSGYIHNEMGVFPSDKYGLVMGKAKGENLQTLLQEGRLRTYLKSHGGNLQDVILSLLEGLKTIFDNNDGYHADVKPDNIIITTKGGKPRAMLVDYGVAGHGKEETTAPFISEHYMSPEELQKRQHEKNRAVPGPDEPPINQNTDLWAAKVVILEMVSEHQWEATTAHKPWYMTEEFLKMGQRGRREEIILNVSKKKFRSQGGGELKEVKLSDKFASFMAESLVMDLRDRLGIDASIEKVEKMDADDIQ